MRRAALALLFATTAPALAQAPPPPVAIPKALDRSQPHLLHDRLDMSFCEYPDRAIQRHIEGCCRMKVVIGADGRSSRMSGQCTDDVFLPPSRACLAPQSYLPALNKGRAVSSTGDIVVQFRFPRESDNFLQQAIRGLLGVHPPEHEDEDICKRRPGDLIAGLPHPQG